MHAARRDAAQVQGNNKMAQFVLTAAADNFSGLSGQNNQFYFTPISSSRGERLPGGPNAYCRLQVISA
jgi:hypothetical protein